MMQRNIVLVTLLISSVCALQMEVYKDDSPGYELNENSVEMIAKTDPKFPGMCGACKWAMGKLKQRITSGSNKKAIKLLLSHVCDGIGFLKFVCKNLVNKYMGVLIEELSTTDIPETICSNIGVC